MNKKIKKRWIFIALILLFSCINHSRIIDKNLEKHEYEILSELFSDLTRPISPFTPKDTTLEAIKIFESEYKTWISKNAFDLYINDSLIVPHKDSYLSFDIDSSFKIMYKKLFYDTTLKIKKFNLSNLPVRTNFKLIPIHPDPTSDTLYETLSRNEKFMGLFEFSRIEFNESFTKACFYFARHMGPKSGGGEIIFVEKINGKWTIYERKLIWVS
jgi:hypothetical protein